MNNFTYTPMRTRKQAPKRECDNCGYIGRKHDFDNCPHPPKDALRPFQPSQEHMTQVQVTLDAMSRVLSEIGYLTQEHRNQLLKLVETVIQFSERYDNARLQMPDIPSVHPWK